LFDRERLSVCRLCFSFLLPCRCHLRTFKVSFLQCWVLRSFQALVEMVQNLLVRVFLAAISSVNVTLPSPCHCSSAGRPDTTLGVAATPMLQRFMRVSPRPLARTPLISELMRQRAARPQSTEIGVVPSVPGGVWSSLR
jgi:hypothetical protein